MGYPTSCSICIDEKVKPDLSELELSVKPFKSGENPTIMLVGLNPTLVNKKAHTVFELDDSKSHIYRFIVSDVLRSVGIDLNKHIYATNLIKCIFPKEPRIICKQKYGKQDNETVKSFLQPYFMNCRKYFTEEIRDIGPKILISFGEVPHQLLWEEFGWSDNNIDRNMKEAFGKSYRVKILGQDIIYMTCIRPKARGRKEFTDKWPTFIKELKDLAGTIH